ncbi:MAG: formylmethanofuran dehydrogenase subunit C [Gemmataceae bacterium]
MTASPVKTVLRLKQRPHVPLEAEMLNPDMLATKTRDEIAALPLILGKRQVRVDDYFDVEGDGSEAIEIHGDVGRVKWIGRGMTRGSITIHGDAGMHLGAYMSGGSIEVAGNGSDWIGAEMKGGLIRVRGNAGGQIGAAYRGSMSGMRDGVILIGGAAGLEVGMRMRRGIIVVGGKVKDFAGLQMKGGTLVLLSGAEIRTGAWMTRGTILSLAPLRLLPTFAPAATYDPTFLRLYAKFLRPHGIELPATGTYRRYLGDTAVPGKGEILVWQQQ